MKILHIFSLYPDKLLPNFLKRSKIGLDFAAHNLQESIMKGYEENNADFHVINAPLMGSFPPYSSMLKIPSYKSEDGIIDSVSYYNVSLIKRFSKQYSVKSKILDWCKANKGEKCVVVLYNFSCASVAIDIKYRFPNVRVCLLVTDLVEYMSSKNDALTVLNKKLTSLIPHKDYSECIDGYILLAKDMRERLPVGNKPYLHMEGIYNKPSEEVTSEKDTHKVILYTGNINKRYGIENLLKAFSLIKDKDYRLWIRGNGECEEIVKEFRNNDSRIVYFEQMSRNDLLELEKKATVLVNPVPPSQTFTRYFFPSKTLEYMASETPTLMFQLSCFPQGYSNYLYFFEDESVEGMSKRIVEICSKPSDELVAFGKKAAQFISSEKTPKAQTRRMLDFYNSL